MKPIYGCHWPFDDGKAQLAKSGQWQLGEGQVQGYRVYRAGIPDRGLRCLAVAQVEGDSLFLQRPVVGIYYDGCVAPPKGLGRIGAPPPYPGLDETPIRSGLAS